jgi:hypothetical protein
MSSNPLAENSTALDQIVDDIIADSARDCSSAPNRLRQAVMTI